MPRLIIDDLEIEVPKGTKVIEAAERLGIIIPRFCYHKGLGSVGACRMCAVKCLEGPVKGIQMSCMIDAQDGMVVSTTDEETVDFRRHVIEWLMMNHPHDCPVCDEGGHCLLQDMTVSGGHDIRRFMGKKRTYRDQYLGELIQHEMNRCIQCYRCVRFYKEFTGYRDLGVMQIANKVYYGRFTDGALESPFSGNLVDVCPTGVYTDKPSRYRARRWDLDRAPSLCLHCSLGCNTVAGARYREVLRQEARFNDAVNGYFLCDRGRYGFAYAGDRQRPRQPRVGSSQVSWQDALRFAAERLTGFDSQQIACLGSIRSSVETQAVLEHLCKTQGWNRPVHFSDGALQRKVSDAVSRLSEPHALSMREIETMDCIVAVGVDPINEAPMLALAMRQARRNGATVVVIDPRPVFLPFDFEHLAVPVEGIDRCLSVLLKGVISREQAARRGSAALGVYDAMPSSYPLDANIQARISEYFPPLDSSRKLALICGTGIVTESTPALAADLVSLMGAVKDQVGLFYTLPGANAFGAAILSSSGHRSSFADVVRDIEDDKTKALIVVENDPFVYFPDMARLSEAIDRLDLLLVLDYLPSETATRADIFMPTRTLFETESSYINQEGRLQGAAQVHKPGIPIWQVSEGGHPPREYGVPAPGGEPEAAWSVLAGLARELSPNEEDFCREGPWHLVAAQYPLIDQRNEPPTLPGGKRILPERSHAEPFAPLEFTEGANHSPDSMDLLVVDWTFGTEELSRYSSIINKVESEPTLSMHVTDAQKMGLSDGDSILLELGEGSIRVDVKVCENMAAGTLVLPRHRRLNWQKPGGFPARIALGSISRGGGSKR